MSEIYDASNATVNIVNFLKSLLQIAIKSDNKTDFFDSNINCVSKRKLNENMYLKSLCNIKSILNIRMILKILHMCQMQVNVANFPIFLIRS